MMRRPGKGRQRNRVHLSTLAAYVAAIGDQLHLSVNLSGDRVVDVTTPI